MMNWNRSNHTNINHPWVLFLFSNVSKWDICFYLNCLHIYLQPSHRQSHRAAMSYKKRVVVTSNICTRPSEGSEVRILKTEQSFCSEPPQLVCVTVVGQSSMVLACAVRADWTSVPLWALLLWFIGKGGRRQHRNKRHILFLFNLRGHFALPQQGVFDFMLEFFSWWYVTLLSLCLSDWRKKRGFWVLAM